MLPVVPERPVCDGEPAFGSYAGRCADTDLRLAERGVSRLRAAASEKRWHWFGAFDDRLAVGGAVVDAGLFGTAFLWLYDRECGRFLDEVDVVVPAPLVWVTANPSDGDLARVDLPRRRLRLSRDGSEITVTGRMGATSIALSYATRGTALTAICPVPDRDGGINLTQKETGARVAGYVERDDAYRFDGTGMADYSHGLLGRETTWRWAIGNCTGADGRRIDFNLVAGFNGGLENGIWIDGEPRTVGVATFDTGDPESGEDWQVRTDCGTVELTLAVEGCRSHDLDVGLVRSTYDQPLGRWHGRIGNVSVEGVGVAETHRSRW